MSITVADVEAARRTIAGQVLRTPMLPAPKLSELTGAEVHVKYENLQVTNSFKERGALNKLASLSETARSRGVIAMSAGNHAQAVAYHAARLRIPATIVMPVTTPFIKVEATQAHGAEVLLDGETIADAQARAEAVARERDLTWVHPYDDPLVIAGQGTVGDEIVRHRQGEALHAVFVPVGGGGLLAGVAGYIKAVLPNRLRSRLGFWMSKTPLTPLCSTPAMTNGPRGRQVIRPVLVRLPRRSLPYSAPLLISR